MCVAWVHVHDCGHDILHIHRCYHVMAGRSCEHDHDTDPLEVIVPCNNCITRKQKRLMRLETVKGNPGILESCKEEMAWIESEKEVLHNELKVWREAVAGTVATMGSKRTDVSFVEHRDKDEVGQDGGKEKEVRIEKKGKGVQMENEVQAVIEEVKDVLQAEMDVEMKDSVLKEAMSRMTMED
ncbi:hypothetical protein EG329_005159 [Mollisiaceae sp. DMI_Dod_QoI]|nr:hypothetical protein EG329_005159 [Helotiales sp. DMI_Dod_QoI]